MSYDLNQQDIELLQNNPHQLILNSQKLIDSIINQFIRGGHFRFEELCEVKQQVNEELLNRIYKIRNQFQGKSLLRTYLSAIIRNVCNDILRKKVRIHYIQLNESPVNQSITEIIYNLVLEEEMDRLQKAIRLYYKQSWKLLLCLKLRFKVPFSYEDFKNVNNNITQIEFNWFVQKVSPYQDNPDTVILSALTEILNKCENKNNTPDALRKWIKLKINELIEILNGDPPTSHYNEETLQILFEKCFHDEREMMSKVF